MPLSLSQLPALFHKYYITGLSTDSRDIQENEAFFAIKGIIYNGNDYIQEILNKKIKLIITDDKKSVNLDPSKIIYVEDIKTALNISIDIFYHQKPTIMVSATGTNGKSSVVSYIAQIFSFLGKDSATIGTLGVQYFNHDTPPCYISAKHRKPCYMDRFYDVIASERRYCCMIWFLAVIANSRRLCGNLSRLSRRLFHNLLAMTLNTGSSNKNSSYVQHNSLSTLTTPDLLTLRKMLHNLAKQNINYLAFESSSHALAQARLENIKVQAACFTSFTLDHLDYHITKEAYLLAKLKLFTNNLLSSGMAILNSDIQEIEFIRDYLNKFNIKYLTVGLNGDLKITRTISTIDSQKVSFTFNNREYEFNTSIIGSFQASNILIAALLVYQIVACDNFTFEDILHCLPKIQQVQGRMERITKENNKFHIFVDYAHTPDALEKTLLELKNIKQNKATLTIIFGCGGDRDKSKRNIMGQIASRFADNIIITDDNPRNEEPSLIRKAIIQGIIKENGKYIEIADREQAIRYAIDHLQEDDILLVAGKGHENYQIIMDQKIFFNDAEIIKKYI